MKHDSSLVSVCLTILRVGIGWIVLRSNVAEKLEQSNSLNRIDAPIQGKFSFKHNLGTVYALLYRRTHGMHDN